MPEGRRRAELRIRTKHIAAQRLTETSGVCLTWHTVRLKYVLTGSRTPAGKAPMTVRDIMNADVVTVRPETDVRDLVQLLAQHRISGVPVVGQEGELMGVVSATDVVALAAYGGDAARGSGAWDNEEGALDEESASYWRTTDAPLEFVMASATNVPEYQVGDIMTPAVFSVPSTASLPELARFLLRGRIHRALVVDAGELVGIVSAFDVLSAVAQMTELEQGIPL